MKTNKITVNSLWIISTLITAFLIPYLIHFEFNYFGATIKLLKDILKIWIGIPLSIIITSIVIYFNMWKNGFGNK